MSKHGQRRHRLVPGIVQARMGSTRLPGKVMKPILGHPMLERQLERLARSQKLSFLVVATTILPEDDTIEQLCNRLGIACFRGHPTDVLDRYYHCARQVNASNIVRLTADCPLTDPQVVDDAVEMFFAGNYDYVSNTIERTFPDGLDVEVFSFAALQSAWENATLPSEREHVTPYIYKHPEQFRLGVLKSDRPIPRYRWTVDEPADFEFVCQVYEKLMPINPAFATDDVVNLLINQPHLAMINAHIPSQEGYRKSLEQDRIFVSIAAGGNCKIGRCSNE